MQIPVLIEPIAGAGFRARGGEPLPFCAEGTTRDEALAKLKEQLQARLSNGSELVPLEVAAAPNPWVEFAGMFRDDPLSDDWQRAIDEYRREVDADPEYL